MPRRSNPNATGRRPNRPRRRGLRRRVAGKRKAMSAKIYTFNFNLESQYLRSGIGTTQPPVVLTGPAQGPLRPVGTLSPPFYGPSISLNANQMSLANLYDMGLGVTFSAQDIGNISQWTDMFDQYRINYVKLTIENQFPADGTIAGAPGPVAMQIPEPTLYIVEDLDSAAVPTALSQVSGFQGVKKVTLGSRDKNTFTYTFRPRPVMSLETITAPANALGTANSGVGKRGQWIDNQFTDVSHYGMKAWITNWLVTAQPDLLSAYRFTWTYNLSFKQPIAAF